MKKSIKYWNKFTVYGFSFSGPIDLCEYARNARINTGIFPLSAVKENGSEGSDDTWLGGGWYKTKSLEQALKLCEDGWNEGYDFYKSLKNKLERRTDKLQAIPADKSKPINIFVNLSYCWETPASAIINRGVIIQNLIRVLENNGYKVNLKAFTLNSVKNLRQEVQDWSYNAQDMSDDDRIFYENVDGKDELSCIVITLKEPNKQLDPRRAYFAFCNPSFHRRINFRIMESSDFKNSGWVKEYGHPCSADFIRDSFNTGKLDIIIPQAWDIGIQGENIVKDWKQFLKYENLEEFFQT